MYSLYLSNTKCIKFFLFINSKCIPSIIFIIIIIIVVLGGLGVTCSPRDPRFAGSNPAEVEGFFQGLSAVGPEPGISGSLKNLKPEKIVLRANFNRHFHILLIPKFGGTQ